ncbi:MAG: type IV pilus modification protein PilV [Sulfuricaulis sp.]
MTSTNPKSHLLSARRQLDRASDTLSWERGFSLIEVLIALLILSIGLLGLAALQTVDLRYNRQSYQRTQAVFQAYDMIDRIRANPTGLTNGDYNAVTFGQGNNLIPSTICSQQSCNPDQLATYDIDKWNTANASLLTNGQGTIYLSNGHLTIEIDWLENDISRKLIMPVDL